MRIRLPTLYIHDEHYLLPNYSTDRNVPYTDTDTSFQFTKLFVTQSLIKRYPDRSDQINATLAYFD